MLLVKVINLLVEPCVEVGADVACRAEQIGVKGPLTHIMLDRSADQSVLVSEIAVQGRLRDAQRTRHFVERGRCNTRLPIEICGSLDGAGPVEGHRTSEGFRSKFGHGPVLPQGMACRGW